MVCWAFWPMFCSRCGPIWNWNPKSAQLSPQKKPGVNLHAPIERSHRSIERPNPEGAMASTSSSPSGMAGGGAGVPLSDEAAAAMAECIGLLFGRWTALQLAVRNRWGGRHSQAKADQLAACVLSWFTRNAAKGEGPLDQDELEELIYDSMDEYFNADIEDGSVEEVTKHLMIMYTRCLRQNYSYIDKLRKTRLAGSAITQSKKVLGGHDSSSDADSDEEDDGAGPMEVEAPRNPKPPKPVPDADGWTTVPTRRRNK